MIYKAYYESPIGLIEIKAENEAIVSLDFIEKKEDDENICEVLKKCIIELDEYFKGKRKNFTVDINLKGTDFQLKAWKELLKIPFGETITYKEQARRIGNEKAVRAVGLANSKNKIAIIVPCHRVVGSDKSLTGYAGGLWRKKWLIDHEKRFFENNTNRGD
ncbi:methylated-DNA-[protein]-cysteine S-methyltransferase [Caloramator fervidus]|uniref:Methylated-DNA--protein-cysteine methyltransferase n=1 Tax=Caloramator fervidus TaxID=29344 RepID=A0A1H5W9V3_9CLOT|nr:methylated-DNA--[protein]-cysteine S-methyltransferase [Caloramator fervidus]SEF95971.1 methylated-DNA-[protein]-cysteine S-methyltransferase [Caloramator fervidus]